ncbi:MAG: hypothetical protein MJ097_01160 [Dorea sp.]|nr:hypothetical protein [Dorea sp.]
MKKIISLLVISMMACALVACGGKNESQEPGETVLEQLPVDASPALKVSLDFQGKAASGDYKTAQELADAMMETGYLEFEPASMAVEPGYLNGFTEEITGFSEGVMFGPAIGSIPFVAYVFVTDDADSLADTLAHCYDLRWNVCTQADEFQCAIVKDKGCVVMAPDTFEE